MRGRPFEVVWREEDTTEALKTAYRRQRDIELRTRLHGLWLLRSGRRLSSVAATVGVHYRTVQTWVAWYREGGVPNVLSHRMGGKGQEPFLTDEAEEQVAEEVATGRFRTAAEMVGAAVNGLKQQTDVAAVVWDGAPSHRDHRVHALGLPLVGLPPYSPELNPAERVFEQVRRWIEGNVYPSLEDKVAAAVAYPTHLESDPNRVRALAGWDWIEDAVQHLPTLLAA